MIQIEQVQRRYDDFSLEVDFSVGRDEIVSLLGSSGSGKSTTLRIIAGFEPLDTGRVLVDGQDISGLSPQRRRLGLVFQDYTLFPHLNVEQNVAYGLRAQGLPRAGRARRAAELLELVGLQGFGPREVQTLSGGEQQRIALARALAPEPRALLLDEPFSAVDTERREELRRYVIRIQRELRIPMIFVTHSRSEALSISDRIVLLAEGRIVETGAPRDLYLRPRTAYAARFLGRANLVPEGAIPVTGSASGPATPPAAGTLLVRPEHIGMAEAEDASCHLPGVVRGVHYRGMFYEYDLETEIGELGAVSEQRFSVGQSVWLGIRRSHLLAEQGHALCSS
ncbi:ABC transporter ATP-binding protein [Spirochaeta africana]|uniref:ABC-type spermidine/putrescine transport system, ATPase component n=1 Tax=Spirochaeta africana (strain ATCC 700263 / DSM 8902 / Z-7692) TaxID=889378 RepID=H9UM92_SPIAZ|nr:ABC transporter ATP-binding protein [Spirochaeta africana]AFG38635.1 ABC-type spermidine/putrescine transport system, ATPase component [Spirochaeta africana DSM 8902]